MLRAAGRIGIVLLGTLAAWTAWSASSGARLQGAEVFRGTSLTRVVFFLDRVVAPRLMILDSPRRVVLDLPATRLSTSLGTLDVSRSYVRRIRTGVHPGHLRVVLDVHDAVVARVGVLRPNSRLGYRLVVELEERAALPGRGQRLAKPSRPLHRVMSARPATERPLFGETVRQWVIVLDAGHGGKDPGARGSRYGTLEKDVTLAIARRLAALIDQTPGMKAVLTRKGDDYVGLEERKRFAQRFAADLLVSIHADAFVRRNVRGSSVFVPTPRGVMSAAGRGAIAREQYFERVSGIVLTGQDPDLTYTLLDLMRSATLAAGYEVARNVLAELARIGEVHRREIQFADFVVLTSLATPSILVETGFITHPDEERRLRSPHDQDRLAAAIHRGIVRYFRRRHPHRPSVIGTMRHTIVQGDTLTRIARRYRTSVQALRRVNGLRGDLLVPGTTLVIPSTRGI